MRLRHLFVVPVLVAAIALPGVLAVTPALGAAPNLSCPSDIVPGSANVATAPWPESQLQLQAVSEVNQGQYVSSGTYHGQRFTAGEPVPVAVIDSGLNTILRTVSSNNPVFRGADVDRPIKIQKWRLPDCVGHGTEVASLIVGQPVTGPKPTVLGIAPRVHLIPIQYTNADQGGTAANLVAALRAAIDAHVRVINLSLESPNPPIGTVMAELEAARRAGIVIVAAGGNDNSQSKGPFYPAAMSKQLNNVIAVAAVDQNGKSANFGSVGPFIDVSAPGVGLVAAVRDGGFKNMQDGTSFAAPFVTGTVALLLATHPDMTPAEVKNRIEATADPPPGAQPNSQYGWGMINPLLAITSDRDDTLATPSPKPGRPLAAPQAATAPDRGTQHRALAIAVGLLGLAALTVTGAAILRGNRRVQARRS